MNESKEIHVMFKDEWEQVQRILSHLDRVLKENEEYKALLEPKVMDIDLSDINLRLGLNTSETENYMDVRED